MLFFVKYVIILLKYIFIEYLFYFEKIIGIWKKMLFDMFILVWFNFKNFCIVIFLLKKKERIICNKFVENLWINIEIKLSLFIYVRKLYRFK